MSEQKFLDYMAENGYTEVRINHYKIRDHVWYKSPDGNRVQVILAKGLHIKTFDSNFYHEIAETRDFMMMMHFVEYWERIISIESGEPFQPYWLQKCNRCHKSVYDGWMFPIVDRDEFGDLIEWLVCEDCDWELMNGYELMQDDYDIWQDRRERAYAYDPVNEPYPW